MLSDSILYDQLGHKYTLQWRRTFLVIDKGRDMTYDDPFIYAKNNKYLLLSVLLSENYYIIANVKDSRTLHECIII